MGVTERAQEQPTEAEVTAETIANLRAERERPNLWIHITEGECYQLLAGVVQESVKLACYESTDAYWQAQLQQNAEKPTARPRSRPPTSTERTGMSELIPDKPRNRPTVPDVQPLVDAYYQFDGCGVGGGLHIVLDDNNIADSHIQSCIDGAAEHSAGHIEETQLLGRVLLLLTRTQRRKIKAGYGGAAMSSADFIARCRALLNTPASPETDR